MSETVYEAKRQTVEEKKSHASVESTEAQTPTVEKTPEIVIRKNMALGKSPLLGD